MEAIVPRQVLKSLGKNRSLSLPATNLADTPADLLLNMLGDLLEGRMPDMRDVVFIRTYLLSNQDVYQPLNLRGHIKEANLDAEVAQSLMNQLGDASPGGNTTASPARAVVRHAFKNLKTLATPAESTAAPAVLRHSASGARLGPRMLLPPGPSFTASQNQFLQPSQSSVGQGCDTLTSALALILTPQPAFWIDGYGSNDNMPSDTATGNKDCRFGPLGSAGAAGPGPPSGLLDKAASLLLHGRDKSRRRASVDMPNMPPDLSGSGAGLTRLHSGSVSRRSLAGVMIVEAQQLGGTEPRMALRRSLNACGDDRGDSSPVTTEPVDGESGGGGGGATAEVPAPRRLSVLWDMFARRNTGSLGSPRKVSLDGRPSGGAGGTPVGASFSVTRPISTPYMGGGGGGHLTAAISGAGQEALLHATSRLGMPPSRAASVRCPVCVPDQAGNLALAAANYQKRSMPPPLAVIEEVERLLAKADSWHFDTWALQEATGGHALSALGFFLMQREGLIDCFRLKAVLVARLLRQVEAGYLDNPYHNATHAADVLQTLHVIIHSAQLHVHYLDPLGLLAAYYAAIVHDFAHPGLTSDYLVATSDPLAVRYNDRSPLENHHCAASFALLQRPELDALAPLSQAERTTFRKQVIEMVLATDMKQHFSILSHFNTVHRLAAYSQQQQQQQQQPSGIAAASPAKPARRPIRRTLSRALSTIGDQAPDGASAGLVPPASPEPAPKPVDDTERLLSLQVALKCADIGHLGEALEVHKRWLGVLEEEFFQQGDKERERGLPISPLFDRSKQGVSKSQVGFYDFVALPLVHALSTAFPGAQPLMRCFIANYNHWRVADGQAPVEVPVAKGARRSGQNRPSGQFVGLGSLLLTVPDEIDDDAKV